MEMLLLVLVGPIVLLATFSVAYMLGYAHGRLWEIEGRAVDGPGLGEIDQAEPIVPPIAAERGA
jgi:hypothetical protein